MNKLPRCMLLPCMLLLPLALVASPARADQSIDQKDKQFSQEAVTVKPGEAINFTNSDQVTHDLSVKNPDGSRMKSVMQKPGDASRITFDNAGDYKVQCLIHPKMKLTVTVQ